MNREILESVPFAVMLIGAAGAAFPAQAAELTAICEPSYLVAAFIGGTLGGAACFLGWVLAPRKKVRPDPFQEPYGM